MINKVFLKNTSACLSQPVRLFTKQAKNEHSTKS